MDKERVIVYIDENTDDGMMWEELNQEGQMQVSVYDEELEYDVEYSHSIVVKSLQEYLADYTKQVCENIRKEFEERLTGYKWEDKLLVGKFCNITNDILDQIEKGE